jgi:thiol-disulfide isomerase/thioredoxin/outer membrane lipoprotein-sorting protein
VRIGLVAVSIFGLAFALPAQQQPQQEFTDPMVLLQAVAKNYAGAVDTFRIESITDNMNTNDLSHDWRRTYRTAIKGPGNLYRIEVRTSLGSYIQISDGVNEWVYQVESNTYVKRPVPQDWPKFPKMMDIGSHEMKNAWDQRTRLEDEALGYRHAVLLPQETILVEGRRFSCYVVRDDPVSRSESAKDNRWEATFWIDKQTLVFRKIRWISDGFMMPSKNLHIPLHDETTDLYPVADFSPQTSPEVFRFAPPEDAKEVASQEPDYGTPLPSPHPKAEMVGQVAPELAFAGADGKKITLTSYRGKPLLIDLWATWCGSCLISMPSLNRIYRETKDKGLVVVSFDQNPHADDAVLYLDRHGYKWTNFHDDGQTVQKAFKGDGIPLMVLLDAQGKIVYYDFGGDEVGLRKAIAGLGPEFASIAAPGGENLSPATKPAEAGKSGPSTGKM